MTNAIRASLAGLLLVLAIAPNVYASDEAVKALRGVTTVSVEVAEMNPAAQADGLDADQVQQDVQLRLRQSGISVGELAPAILYVRVQLLKSMDRGIYAYDITVSLDQEVFLARDRSIGEFRADTWETGVSGIVPVREMSQEVRRDLADYVNRFINAYLERIPARGKSEIVRRVSCLQKASKQPKCLADFGSRLGV